MRTDIPKSTGRAEGCDNADYAPAEVTGGARNGERVREREKARDLCGPKFAYLTVSDGAGSREFQIQDLPR